jgi:DNA modification methylase
VNAAGSIMELVAPRSNRPQIEWVAPEDLKSNPLSTRAHNRKQLLMLGTSIARYGFRIPVIADETNLLLSGHARVQAAKEIGLKEIPVFRACNLSEADQRAFMIAENRLAQLSSWNDDALRRELNFLSDLDIDFDFAAIGFTTPEVDFILEAEEEDNATAVLPPADVTAVSRPGDLWLADEHRILCGSALDAPSYQTLLPGNRAHMAFTDPPYNVRIEGHVSRTGKKREFAMACGEMSEQQFTEFLRASLSNIQQAVVGGALLFVCMDWRHLETLLTAARPFELKNVCVWVKNNPGMGSLYRSQHELVFVLKSGNANHINNVELGKHGRNRSNVWEYPALSSFGRDRDKLLDSHPTVKPLALVADAIKDCSRRGDIILDPFGGSGTTLLAAEKTKRRAAVIEIDPLYVDVAIRRWQRLTGRQAVLNATGEPFPERERAQVTEGGGYD